MMRFWLRSVTYILLVGLITGCGDAGPPIVLMDKNGFSVISEPYLTYGDSGSTTNYSLVIKANGREVDIWDLSRMLFSDNDPCGGHLYQISEFRKISDDSILAVFNNRGARCSDGQLVKLFMRNGRLQMLRLNFSPKKSGVDSGRKNGVYEARFWDLYAMKMEKNMDDIASLTHTQKWVSVTPDYFQYGDDPESNSNSKRVIAIKLFDLSRYELGKGELTRFVGDDENPIALMKFKTQDDIPDAYVQFRAVRVNDGKVLDKMNFPLPCFFPVGEKANERVRGYIQNQQHQDSVQRDQTERWIVEYTRLLQLTSEFTEKDRAEMREHLADAKATLAALPPVAKQKAPMANKSMIESDDPITHKAAENLKNAASPEPMSLDPVPLNLNTLSGKELSWKANHAAVADELFYGNTVVGWDINNKSLKIKLSDQLAKVAECRSEN